MKKTAPQSPAASPGHSKAGLLPEALRWAQVEEGLLDLLAMVQDRKLIVMPARLEVFEQGLRAWTDGRTARPEVRPARSALRRHRPQAPAQ
ncbi:MAG: hypothetical protein JNG86_12620 [Verrucomicrobiaceae bacterium]|nr:hypothetical protein [Verrucomicrobiaceae bacterium]